MHSILNAKLRSSGSQEPKTLTEQGNGMQEIKGVECGNQGLGGVMTKYKKLQE